MPAPYITLADIQAIYAVPDGIDPNAFIAYSSSFLNNNPNISYPADVMKSIQAFLTCHFIMAFEPQTMSYRDMKLNNASYGQQLMSTPYGQMAMGLDINGYLKGFGLKKARMFAV